jgi:hypothetical protein
MGEAYHWRLGYGNWLALASPREAHITFYVSINGIFERFEFIQVFTFNFTFCLLPLKSIRNRASEFRISVLSVPQHPNPGDVTAFT